MRRTRKRLNNTHGYTLIEVLISLTIFAIGIIPIYQMIVSGARIQNVAEETYEATMHSQALLQEVKNQMEEDIRDAYDQSRDCLSTPVGKSWLNGGTADTSLIAFLGIDSASIDKYFNEKYNLDNYLYEVHIWDMKGPGPLDDRISFIAYKDPTLVPTFTKENTYNFTNIAIASEMDKYFANNESLVWAGLGETKPKAIGEIVYEATDTLKIRGEGIAGHNIRVDDIDGYGYLNNNIKLIYGSHKEGTRGPLTHELIVDDIISLSTGDLIELAIDLTTFPHDSDAKVIRIENRTKATVVIPVYNEKNNAGIEIYPIQHETEGKIIVEERSKLEPCKNFIIGIIVKDANNIAFGEPHKILSKIVDVYSFDYNKQ